MKTSMILSDAWAKRRELRAEGHKLWTEGDKLYTEGDELWDGIVLKAKGNIKLEWKNWDGKKMGYECHLETGEVFKP